MEIQAPPPISPWIEGALKSFAKSFKKSLKSNHTGCFEYALMNLQW